MINGSGLLVTVEGMDGAGKSTVCRTLVGALISNGVDVIPTRELGGTIVGEKLREIFLDDAYVISPTTEMLIAMAARNDHIEKVIMPHLQENKIVVCDRFRDSTHAYQVKAGEVDRLFFLNTEQSLSHVVIPDITVLVDVDVDIALSRIGGDNRIEKKSKEYFNCVRDAFRLAAEKEPNRFIIIDGNKPIDVVMEEVNELAKTIAEKHLALTEKATVIA